MRLFISPPIILWLLLCFSASVTIIAVDQQLQNERRQADMQRELSRAKSHVEERINRYFTLVQALEALVHSEINSSHSYSLDPLLFEKKFQSFVAPLESQNPSVISLQLAPRGVVSYVSQLDKNSAAIGHDLLRDDARRKQVIRTIINKTTVVAGPLKLIQGGNALVARKAIFTEKMPFNSELMYLTGRAERNENWPKEISKDFWGFATMLVDTDKLFDEFKFDQLPKAYQFALRGRHGLGDKGDVFWGDDSVFDYPDLTTEIRLPGGSWVMGIRQEKVVNLLNAVIVTAVVGAIFILGCYVILARRAKLQAEAEAKTHDRFLAAMSHEIRTPMNGIIGVVELLEMSELSEEQREKLEIIKVSSNTLLRIVNDVLDFSKIDSGAMSLEIEPLKIETLARTSCQVLEQQAHAKGLTLECFISERTPTQITGDTVRLQQVLTNLLSNSVKFTQSGFVRLSIDYTDDGSKKQIEFEVKDSGIGIDKQGLERIFKPFQQAEQGAAKRFEGTGLGLVISDRLVQQMGGTIKVLSKLGQGSSFKVCVPFFPVPAETNFAADENNLKASPNRVPDDIKPVGTKLRDDLRLSVLVVDDVFINIEVATMILESLGCQTDRAMSGQEAIDAVKNKSYDIIYMDRQMPEMDGIEATQRIRKISGSETVPWIVALTASAQEDQKEEYLQAGANDFLSKPIDVDSVSRSVENYKKIKLS